MSLINVNVKRLNAIVQVSNICIMMKALILYRRLGFVFGHTVIYYSRKTLCRQQYIYEFIFLKVEASQTQRTSTI